MTTKYKAVFFDLDGTIRIATPSPTDAFVLFARLLDIEISSSAERRVKLWAHHYWGQDQRVKQDMERFDIDDFWINYSRQLLEKVDVTEDLARRAQLVREWFGNEYAPHVTLAESAYQTLDQLKRKGYWLGLISNRADPLDNTVAELGLNGLFDMTLAAGEIGYWKPNPTIFSHALVHFQNVEPDQCVYIGDNYYADGHGAKAAGMHPVIFDPDNLYEAFPFLRIKRLDELLHWL